ncbi:MAG: hypothetical protein HOY78_02680 [Saccharothrix sp.]|nr:hypothetical protein [Saccharothrix sp.]
MTTQTPRFRWIGITDECVECQKCGKTELRSTVVLAMLDEDGNTEDYTYYGSTCAARALGIRGGGRSVLNSARAAHEHTLETAKDARRTLAYYGLPETGEVDAETLRAAMITYVGSNSNVHRLVRETGKKVSTMVMEMLAGLRAAIAEAEMLRR